MLRPTFFLIRTCARLTNRSFVTVSLRKNNFLTSNAPAASTMVRLNASNSSGYVVKHDPSSSSFYIDIQDKGHAVLEYQLEDEIITILHTEIPETMKGMGIGKIIAKAALEYVAKNNLELKIECEFVEHYVNKYEPKYLKYMSNDA